MKEQIKKINNAAKENIEFASGMLEMFNEIHGTEFFFIAKRVSFKDSNNRFRDAYVWAE